KGSAMVAEVSSADIRAAISGKVPAAAIFDVAREAGAAGAPIESADGAVIDVAEAVTIAEVVIAAVVAEVAAAPVSTVDAGAEVAETVVDAAVVADTAAPVTGVPEVAAAAPAP